MFAITAGVPTEKRQEVVEGFGEIAGFAEIVDHDFGQIGFLEADDFHDLGLFDEVELGLIIPDPCFQTIGGQAAGDGQIREGFFGGLDPLMRALSDLAVPVPLGEFFAGFGGENHGQMGVNGAFVSQCLLQRDVIDGVQQMFLAAQNVGDAHVGIVDDHGEVIRRHAVALADDEVLHLICGHTL